MKIFTDCKVELFYPQKVMHGELKQKIAMLSQFVCAGSIWTKDANLQK